MVRFISARPQRCVCRAEAVGGGGGGCPEDHPARPQVAQGVGQARRCLHGDGELHRRARAALSHNISRPTPWPRVTQRADLVIRLGADGWLPCFILQMQRRRTKRLQSWIPRWRNIASRRRRRRWRSRKRSQTVGCSGSHMVLCILLPGILTRDSNCVFERSAADEQLGGVC